MLWTDRLGAFSTPQINSESTTLNTRFLDPPRDHPLDGHVHHVVIPT